MAQLTVPCYSSESLSHSARKGILVGEASDLGYRGTGQLYDDACDVGIALMNPRSGNITRWSQQRTLLDPHEGELMGWVFVPTPETVHRQPELKDYELRLIND